jgi:hypothetical protein
MCRPRLVRWREVHRSTKAFTRDEILRTVLGNAHSRLLLALWLAVAQSRGKIGPDPAHQNAFSVKPASGIDWSKAADSKTRNMTDRLMLVLLACAFAGAVAYVDACVRLLAKGRDAEDLK